MQNSIILAQAFGIYLVVISVALLVRPKVIMDGVIAITKNKGIHLISSIFPTLIGSFLVAYHNIWTKNWIVIITVLCWIILAKGVLSLLFPEIENKFIKNYYNSAFLIINGVILLLIGVFLLYHGCYLGADSPVKKYIFF